MTRALLALCALAGAAAAEPIRWTATRGTMEPGRIPGSFWLTTEAVPGRFSNGEVISSAPIELPFRIDVTWRRIGPEAGRSMHLTLAGAVLLLQAGRIGVYTFDESKFEAEGWTRVPAIRPHDEQALSVVQDAKAITVFLDGKQILHYPFAVARPRAPVGVGMKGAKGFRSAIYVRSLAVAAP